MNILHILISDYKLDSRVKNITESLSSAGYNVEVFCLKSFDTVAVENRNGVNIFRFGYPSNKSLHILSSYFHFLLRSKHKNFSLIHAHDFTGLIISYLISKFNGIPLIYDSHELWSQSHHENYPKYVLELACSLEKYCAKRANYIFTVSDSIRDYLKAYFNNQNVKTIRNVPSYLYSGESNIFREKLSIPNDIPIFIYQGALSRDRGIDVILNALVKLRGLKFKFIFLGHGNYYNHIEQYIRTNKLNSNVSLLDSVSQDQLIMYLKSADIGIHAISNTCLNHEYCLPNKIFEYIHAGLAILCTNLREMSKLVHQNEIGDTFRDNDSESLAEKMTVFIREKDNVNKYKMNSRSLSRNLTWHKEFIELEEVYRKLLCIH